MRLFKDFQRSVLYTVVVLLLASDATDATIGHLYLSDLLCLDMMARAMVILTRRLMVMMI